MKKGINIWSFDGSKSLADIFKLAKAAGFEGIELSFDASGPVSMESSEKDLLDVKKAAADEGLALYSLASGQYWDYSMTSADQNKRDHACEIVKKQLHAASVLGCDTILVIPGAVKPSFIPESEVVPYDVAYDRALESVSALASVAEGYKVNIGLENVWNQFLVSPLEMRGFIDAVGSKYVGSYFDIGNVVYNGFPEHWISILGSRIKKVHFKDYRRAAGGLHGFVDLLAGDVDWPAVTKALASIGYDDWVSGEMIPAYTHYTDQIIFNTSLAMDRILGR